MNALVNSQEQTILQLAESYQKRTGNEMPVRVARYTGQDSKERKQELQANPPRILLTNYVMLEMMLVRPVEKKFVDRATTALQFLVLQFLVMDELHTYRGRQGADVALLVRRLRERSGNPNLLCIGTSATMANEGGRAERRGKVAEFATRFFGVSVEPERVIEDTFGVREEEGQLRRQLPITLQPAARRLSHTTQLDPAICRRRLQQMIELGSRIRRDDDNTAVAFKLHQFISQGSSVYSTLEPSEERYYTLDGQYYAPGGQNRLLYPLAFCRQYRIYEDLRRGWRVVQPNLEQSGLLQGIRRCAIRRGIIPLLEQSFSE